MIETIGQAMDLSVQIEMRCAWGKRDGLKSIRECDYSLRLDMATLVATRGRDLPIAMLAERLRCPRCGSRRVRILYGLPSTPMQVRAAVRGW